MYGALIKAGAAQPQKQRREFHRTAEIGGGGKRAGAPSCPKSARSETGLDRTEGVCDEATGEDGGQDDVPWREVGMRDDRKKRKRRICRDKRTAPNTSEPDTTRASPHPLGFLVAFALLLKSESKTGSPCRGPFRGDALDPREAVVAALGVTRKRTEAFGHGDEVEVRLALASPPRWPWRCTRTSCRNQRPINPIPSSG